MLRNYLLLAFKVLQRHKFYTFISLSGISITLMVLIVLTSLIESFIHPAGPERDSDNFLVAGTVMMQQRNDEGVRTMRSIRLLGFRFAERELLTMQTPELVSVFAGAVPVVMPGEEVVGFRDGVKIESFARRTDATYWRILQFDFIEGRPINQQEHEAGAYVAVISESTRNQYFDGHSAVGQRIALDGSSFEVIGVVEDVSPLQTFATADVWLPLFATASTQFRSEDRGQFMVLMKARTPGDLPRIREEYQTIVKTYELQQRPEFFENGRPVEMYSHALSKPEFYLQIVGNDFETHPREQSTGRTVVLFLGGGMLLFMLLPVINLVNINISRILDRASEIGVRKSFGASSGHLVRQFIVENLVVTALGGALGFVLAILVLRLLGDSALLPNEAFHFNYRVFGLGLLYILVFSLLSAVYPAWKMSRLDPVHALKGAV